MYKENLQLLFDLFKRVLLPESLLIWTTTMPISESVRGGVILDKISFLSSVLRLDVLLANYFASQVATGHGFDVLDLHFVFRRKLNLRLADGIHWNSQGHRIISNMLLRHVSSAWNVVLPLDSKRQPTQLQYPLPTKCTEWVSGARPEGERNRQSTSTGNSGAYSSSAMSNASGSNASSKCATAAGRSVSNVNQKCKGVESRFVRITGFTCPSTPVRAALLPLPVPVLPQNGYQMVGSVMANWPSATVQNCGKAASSATMRNFTLRYKPY